MPDSEVERLKRLREKQLKERDPLAGERKFQKNLAIKEKRMRKPLSLTEDWKNVPYVIKLPLYALLGGVVGSVILSAMWSWAYAVYAGIGVTILIAIFAAVLGNALDLRNDIKKHLK